ncbi:MAG TPA: glutamine-hydrolyzing carbamoyl-phosphate synthase small subunit [Actinomycetota bacterium]|nr:glutamine-hydrolyzing carbamoyl-phosphate synthase small subunit [Actinomycetota bacterium]
MSKAILVLEDGTTFPGRSFGAPGETFGEVVFNTSLSGYQEVLTDPSYYGQIVCMTYPHIGSYGVTPEDVESGRIQVSGFAVRDAVREYSNWRATQSIHEYLEEAGITAIEEIDTRKLTRHIRSLGAMRGAISTDDLDPASLRGRVLASPSMEGLNLVDPVTTAQPYRTEDVLGIKPSPRQDGRIFRVAAYDYGIKFNILRLLAAHGCDVTVYPAAHPAADLLAAGYDGVFLSNGPGDPASVRVAIDNAKTLLGNVPVFGICLGNQILGLALGGGTYKLKFGHRGINQPVKRLATGAVEITSHNHGFAVDADSFPRDGDDSLKTEFGRAEISHVNLNDGCVEGLRCLDVPAFSVQYHPEAAPGPHDARYLFEEFATLMANPEEGQA